MRCLTVPNCLTYKRTQGKVNQTKMKSAKIEEWTCISICFSFKLATEAYTDKDKSFRMDSKGE